MATPTEKAIMQARLFAVQAKFPESKMELIVGTSTDLIKQISKKMSAAGHQIRDEDADKIAVGVLAYLNIITKVKMDEKRLVNLGVFKSKTELRDYVAKLTPFISVGGI